MTSMLPATTSFSLAPEYATDDLGRTLAMLQQIQVAMGQWCHPTEITLADVTVLLSPLEQQFGTEVTLEAMIQYFVGQSLKQQRVRHKQQCAVVAEGVAA